MWSKRYGFGIVVVLLGLGVAGCPAKEVKPVGESNPFVKPALEYRGIRFENQTFMGMDVSWRFELVSKDARVASVQACSYKVDMEGFDPLSGPVTGSGDLSGDKKIVLASQLAVPWPEDKTKVKDFLGKKRIPYSYFIDCNLNGPEGAFKVSASDSGTIPLPKLPEMNVTGANAEKFTGRDIRLNFELSILNENPFHLKLKKIVYKISAEGRLLSEGTIPVADVIPPSNEASYDISTGTLSGDESREIKEMIKKPEIHYHLEGNVIYGDFEIPVDEKGTVSFPR